MILPPLLADAAIADCRLPLMLIDYAAAILMPPLRFR